MRVFMSTTIVEDSSLFPSLVPHDRRSALLFQQPVDPAERLGPEEAAVGRQRGRMRRVHPRHRPQQRLERLRLRVVDHLSSGSYLYGSTPQLEALADAIDGAAKGRRPKMMEALIVGGEFRDAGLVMVSSVNSPQLPRNGPNRSAYH